MTLKKLVGHDDFNSPEIYSHVGMSDVRKALEKHLRWVIIATTNSEAVFSSPCFYDIIREDLAALEINLSLEVKL